MALSDDDSKVGEALAEKAEDFVTTKADWVFSENDSKWVECFKKSSNILDIKAFEKEKLKKHKMDVKDFKLQKKPFISHKFLQMV